MFNAADNSSKRNPKGMATGFSTMEVIGALNRDTVGRAVGGWGWGGGLRKTKRREIAASECSQLFREELQCKGVKIQPGEQEVGDVFILYTYIILER